MAQTLTISNVDAQTYDRLNAEARRRGIDLETAALEVLAKGVAAVGLADRTEHARLMRELAGTWNSDDLRDFNAATEGSRQIDEEVWR